MSLNPIIDRIESEPNPNAPLQAVLVASPDGSVQFITARAELWIRDFFLAASPLNRLPEVLIRWLSSGASGTRSPLISEQAGRRLHMWVIARESKSVCLLLSESNEALDNATLRLNENPSPNSIAALQRYLTNRQIEVLSWLAYGKTNSEIASILGLKTRTIGKYLERIFPKLGVENRTAAAARFFLATGFQQTSIADERQMPSTTQSAL